MAKASLEVTEWQHSKVLLEEITTGFGLVFQRSWRSLDMLMALDKGFCRRTDLILS